MTTAAAVCAKTELEQMQVLLIEDDPLDAEIMSILLGAAHLPPFGITVETTLAKGVERVQRGGVDLIFLDLHLPDGGGIGNVERMMSETADTPIIVLTGLDDRSIATEAVRVGAQDYLVKGGFDAADLRKSIEFAISRHRLRQEVEAMRRRETETRDRFLSHVSHELRTPLTAILQFATILRDGIGVDVDEKQRRYAGVICRNTDQLKRMIDTLLDVTRAEAGKLSCQVDRVDPEAVLLSAIETIEPQAAAAELRLETIIDDDLPTIVGDASRLEQVLSNLLGNALKFTPTGGTITATITKDAAADAVEFSVTDTGCGMPAEATANIFDRMFQVGQQNDVSRKGLGLGLYISQEIVQIHGGTIHVESTLGSGSCFRFSIPAYSVASCVERTAAGSGRSPLSLIAVSVAAASATARARRPAAVAHEVASLLTACMHEVSDAVLPFQRSGSDREMIYGLASTDLTGADAIAARLRVAIEQHPRLTEGGFVIDVARDRIDSAMAEDHDDRLARVTREVEHRIRQHERGNRP